MRHGISAVLAFGLLVGSAIPGLRAQEATPAWLKSVEVTLDPPEKELQVVSLRLTPGTTRSYTQLRFECVYRQEFDWTDSSGKTLRRINEPVRFTYERDQVRLTDDLDTYVSFKVPIGMDLLRSRYGTTVFRPETPVAIARIRIEARSEETAVWACEVPVREGPQALGPTHWVRLDAATKGTEAKPRSERAKFGTVDLD